MGVTPRPLHFLFPVSLFAFLHLACDLEGIHLSEEGCVDLVVECLVSGLQTLLLPSLMLSWTRVATHKLPTATDSHPSPFLTAAVSFLQLTLPLPIQVCRRNACWFACFVFYLIDIFACLFWGPLLAIFRACSSRRGSRDCLSVFRAQHHAQCPARGSQLLLTDGHL